VKLQPDSIENPLQKMRKQLSNFPASPTPEEVHLLRTHTRRLEATVKVLGLESDQESRQLLKIITPVRKAAGKVRDMDVLIGHTTKISADGMSEAVVRLVEHLAKMRVKHARRLDKVLSERREEICEGLKRSARLMRKKLTDPCGMVDGQAAPQILIAELSHWPELDEGNLHLFRIRIKELRYMLQLGKPSVRLLGALGEVKDTVGEWHDWTELRKIAADVLDPGTEGEVLASIAQIAEEKLGRSLAAASRMRARYLGVPDGRKASRRLLQMAS